MNLAMHEETEKQALIEALSYNQKRLKEVETEHERLKKQVDIFLGNIKENFDCFDDIAKDDEDLY